MNPINLPHHPIGDQGCFPPEAKKERIEHIAHGDRRIDDYHWLRDKNNPDTLFFLQEWNAYTEKMMEPIKPLAEKLYREVVSRLEANSQSVPYEIGPYSYYQRMEEGKEYPIYCRTLTGKEQEEILLDANAFAKDLPYFDELAMEPSREGRYVAFSIDSDGSQFGKIYVKDLERGEFLDEEITGSERQIVWNPDSTGFWYAKVNEELRVDRIFFHKVGTDPAEDLVVQCEENPLFELHVEKDKLSRFCIVTSASSDTSEVKIASIEDPSAPFYSILPREEGVKMALVPGDKTHCLLVSRSRANWELWRTSDSSLRKKEWEVLLPSDPAIDLLEVELFEDHMALLKREKGIKRIEVWNLRNGEKRQVAMPQEIGDIEFEHNETYATSLLRFTFDSPITPLCTYHYHMDGDSLTLLKQKKAGDFDPSLYTSERIWAVAEDGVEIPISLFYRKGFSRNGKNPLYLYAYGSYGVTYDPHFNPVHASFLERGICFAIAHIRGGGDLGRQWYEQGSMQKKKQTFSDFISCAEHLIDAGYTSPERLVIHGASAGGLLMGAVVNLRPELFKACLAGVPFVDVVTTMFDEMLPLTTQEWKEWGNPNEEEFYRYMKSYSPIDNVKAQEYPYMYVIGGWNDQQVSYHEPAKWVAKLQEYKTDNKPLLFRTNMGAGHHGASGRYSRYRERASDMAFLIHHLGFQE